MHEKLLTEERFYYRLHPLIYLPVSIITIFSLVLEVLGLLQKSLSFERL